MKSERETLLAVAKRGTIRMEKRRAINEYFFIVATPSLEGLFFYYNELKLKAKGFLFYW